MGVAAPMEPDGARWSPMESDGVSPSPTEESVRRRLLLISPADVEEVAGDREARAERRLLVTRVRDGAARRARQLLGVREGVTNLGAPSVIVTFAVNR